MKYTNTISESRGSDRRLIAVAIALLAAGVCLISGMRPKLLLACGLVLLIVCGVMLACGLRRRVSTGVTGTDLKERYKYEQVPPGDDVNTDSDNGRCQEQQDVTGEENRAADTAQSDKMRLASEFLFDDLNNKGCLPIQDDDNSIIFKYQGGYFRATNLDREIIRVIFPRIFSISATKQDFLCRLLNRINGSYAICRLTAIRGETDGTIEVHGYADFYYTSALTERVEVLEEILSVFFMQQRSLLLSAGIQEAIEMEDEDPDYPDICQTSYKDISLN